MNRLAPTTCAFLLLLATSAWSSEWAGPSVQERGGGNAPYSVRVTPGDRTARRPAMAEWYRLNGGTRERIRTASLLNPVSPVDFVVTDTGMLVTLDNWHSAGTGYVLVIYSPEGLVVRKYTLSDLYSVRDFRRFPLSGSSILWRCFSEDSTSLGSAEELRIDDALGGRLLIQLQTGAVSYRRAVSSCSDQHRKPSPLSGPIVERQPAARQWGAAVGNLQLGVGTISGPELPEDDSIVHLFLSMRNLAGAAVPFTTGRSTYDFEYEIDGTWYAFDPAMRIPTLHEAGLANQRVASGGGPPPPPAIEPGLGIGWDLSLPLTAPSPTLQLRAIVASGAGQRFEPTPGVHLLRVRPRQMGDDIRQAPVSNAETIALKPLAEVQTRGQSISFDAAREAPLNVFRFASGPAGDRALIGRILARPPQPAKMARVMNAAAHGVIGPLPFHTLKLPYYSNARNPDLPANTGLYHYLVRSADQPAAIIELAAYKDGPSASPGPVLKSVEPVTELAPLFEALLHLAGMEAIRGGRYEPRLLQVTGDRGMKPLQVIWLRSRSVRSDLFYRPRDPGFTGATRVEPGRLYSTTEFLAAVRSLPRTPQHDAAWAIGKAAACAGSATPNAELVPDRAEVETGVGEQQDRVIWYVYIPAIGPLGVITSPLPAASLQVDDLDGSCKPIEHG